MASILTLSNPYMIFTSCPIIAEVLKSDLINRFNYVTKYMDECYKSFTINRRTDNLINYIEIKLWENLLNCCDFIPDDDIKYLCLRVD